MNWMKCSDCAHVYTDSFFNDEGIKLVFSHVMHDGIFGGNLDKQREDWARVIHLMLPYSQGTWVDVGVGNGGFLFAADEFGLDAVGIDSRGYVLEPLKTLGYKVEKAEAMEYDYTGASAVILADVLEHIPYPKALLKRIRESLVGALYVSCPSLDSVSWRYMDKMGECPYWKEYEHYHNFTRQRLSDLLKECGFDVKYFGISTRYMAGMEMVAI